MLTISEQFRGIPNSNGKRVGNRLYLHVSAIQSCSPELSKAITDIAEGLQLPDDNYNVLRYDRLDDSVAFLWYPEYFQDPFPALSQARKIMLTTNRQSYRDYSDSLNRPILHRKELLLTPDHPERHAYEKLTEQLESAGLFEDPVSIGFEQQWNRRLQRSGFKVVRHELVPIANEKVISGFEEKGEDTFTVRRHLTALTRSNLSAPVQQLYRYKLIDSDVTVFDYGCGKGDDVRSLIEQGINAAGWDPYFAADETLKRADVVNLGFVINVIEDPAERQSALSRAFELADQLLVVSVMIDSAEANRGKPFADGFVTGRNTFQKYFTVIELIHYISTVLDENPIAVAPGIVFVFKDKEVEQRFELSRIRSAPRINPYRTRSQRPRAPEKLYEQHQDLMDDLWRQCVELGRFPTAEEVDRIDELESAVGSVRKATNLLLRMKNLDELETAKHARVDDLLVYFALLIFEKRRPYGTLELRLQKDIKTFFGTYKAAQDAAKSLLQNAAQPEILAQACIKAAESGLGWLEPEQSLQLHTSSVSRLPAVLRVYLGFSRVLYGEIDQMDLVKIHIHTGKISLMRFDDFENEPLPRMLERVKLNLRKGTLKFFDYIDEYEPPYLYWKSQYINEEFPNYELQEKFDCQLSAIVPIIAESYGPTPKELQIALRKSHLAIEGFRVVKEPVVPDLDENCGLYFTYRNFVECGETQKSTGILNVPTQAESYSALFELAQRVLDPIVDYFGMIKLTYGFCSHGLALKVRNRIAPKLDQHAAHELDGAGRLICERRGAAVDFLIKDENMRDVANWIIGELEFDRLYFYGQSKPIHISYGPEMANKAITMEMSKAGRRMPRKYNV